MIREPFEYSDGETLFKGELAFDETTTAPRPGVLVLHEGGGINDHPKQRAGCLAGLGYVALACDVYGDGSFITDPQARKQRMTALASDPATLRRRVRAALDALSGHPRVDRTRLAAIGYCFGGMCVLELARSGADLRGVVSFHGLLATSQPAQPGAVRAKVLACHGVEDPLVPPDQVAAFMAEMRGADVDWQLITYAHAGHGFTRKDAGAMGIKGIFFEERADARSWIAMRAFLEELFADAPPASATR